GRGASFLPEIARGTGRLPAEVEDALWDLVSAGLVSGDGVAGLRLLLGRNRPPARHTRLRAVPGGRSGAISGISGRGRPLPAGRCGRDGLRDVGGPTEPHWHDRPGPARVSVLDARRRLPQRRRHRCGATGHAPQPPLGPGVGRPLPVGSGGGPCPSSLRSRSWCAVPAPPSPGASSSGPSPRVWAP